MIPIRKYQLVTGGIALAIFSMGSLENCGQPKNTPASETQPAPASQASRFAGSEACSSCHKDIYEQHLRSFHHLTSLPANAHTLKGDFDSANRYYINEHLYIAAEKKQDSFVQTAYSRGTPKLSRPFDIIVGSGKRGQTSIYWFQNYLFELPLTWFTETNEWTISPGYSKKADFNRSITARCLECHTTRFQNITNNNSKAEEFAKSNFILGVECEKCHGPAADHIAFHEKNSAEKTGHAIFNPGKATRQQSLDLCRLCHNGALTGTKPPFSFQAGDKLFDYFTPDSGRPIAQIDVHGNQYGMLAASKCFRNSEMTCLSCHDAHKNQSQQAAQFYVKCAACHKTESHNSCKLAVTVNPDFLEANCINCHMPEQPSKAIMVIRPDESIPTSAHMRSHYIAVYKDISNQILSAKK